MSKGKFHAVPEVVLANITYSMFGVEEAFPEDHPVRKQIYKARCEMGLAMRMNRQNKDVIQEDWVSIAPRALDYINVTITIGDENGNKNDNA